MDGHIHAGTRGLSKILEGNTMAEKTRDEVKAADIIEGKAATVATSGKLEQKKLARFLNEFANTDSRRRSMQSALEEGIAPDAFVDKFFPQSPRAKYIAGRVKEVS